MTSLTAATLPAELILQISEQLLLPDQARLACVCKHFNRVLTPVVWSEIELHHCGSHEGTDACAAGRSDWSDWDELRKYLQDDEMSDEEDAHRTEDPLRYRHVIREPSGRKYTRSFDYKEWESRLLRLCQEENPGHWQDVIGSQSSRNQAFLCVRNSVPRERWEGLAQCVRSLCLSTYVDAQVIEIISSFRNLISLEIVGLQADGAAISGSSEAHLEKGRQAMSLSDVKFSNLKNLKLRGLVPAALVYNICSHAHKLTHLNLGLLASQNDDALYWGFLRDQETSVAEESDESNPFSSESEEPKPWAPHSPLWLRPTVQAPPCLPNLTHLHLVKPFLHPIDENLFCNTYRPVSVKYEYAVNEEWVSLLKSVGSTLKELILDHRWTVERSNDTIWQYDEPEVPVGSLTLGDSVFGKTVLQLFAQESKLFPELRSLAFRGIRLVSDGPPVQDVRRWEDFGDDGPRANLKRLFPMCELEPPEGMYEVYLDEGGASDDPGRLVIRQDLIDGLMRCSGTYQDYVMRFGRQWKVQE